MAIAGIEGLAQGFMQGMALKRQNDRQDVLDAQNLERFGMDKERFATQQAASAFDLQNAQTNAANAATDRTRALGIQKKGDDFDANLSKILGAGSPEGELIELEKIYKTDGVKGAWARDPKTGGLAKNTDGTIKWVNEDGTSYDALPENALGAYIGKVDPKGEYARRVKSKDELAKEDREAKRSDAIAKRDHKYAVNRLYEADSINDGNEKPEKETPLSAADFKSFFGEDYEIGTDANGLTKMGNRINRALQNRFLTWASVNKRKATMSAYQDWVANDPAAQSLASPNKDIDMNGKGVLKGFSVTGGLDKQSAEVSLDDRQPVSVEKPSSSAAQPAVPKSLTIPRPVPTVSYENMPIKSVTKTATKQGRGGGRYTYQEVLATRDMPVPPEGFKRKSLSERDPNFNVFVSNNYQD